MRIALVSLDQIWENKALNAKACEQPLKIAKENQTDLVIFPEMTLTSYSMNAKLIAEDFDKSTTLELFKSFAINYQVAIIFGVVFRNANKITNEAVCLDKNGKIKSTYSKIHPFSFAGEDQIFTAGDKISFFRLNELSIGLTICYDLRFPELYSALRKHCNLIVNIANWPLKRIDHWNTLLKGRAIENQVVVVGVNRTGKDANGIDYNKSSQILSPGGELLVPLISKNNIDIYVLNLKQLFNFGDSFSTVKDRRPDLYKSIL